MKRILAIITDRTEEFSKYNILFIKKFIHEIDEFYMFTTEEAYNNFYVNILDFPHKKVFFEKADFYPNKIGYGFHIYSEYLCNQTEEGSIVYITGDGAFMVKNPFDFIKDEDDFDVINCIYNHHGKDMCFDIGSFFKNTKQTKLFLSKLMDFFENPVDKLKLYPNGNQTQLTNIGNLSRWLIAQDIYWNIYMKNENIKYLYELANIKFFKNRFHWAGNSASTTSFVSTLYDSLFLKEECIINLLGKYKYLINQDFYKYYYDHFFDKKGVITRGQCIDIYKGGDNDAKTKEIFEHYHNIHNAKFTK